MVSFSSQTIKYAIFAFNLLILILAVVIIASGGILLTSIGEDSLNKTISEVPKSSTILLILVGVITFVIAFMGCCGAIKESYALLYGYGTALFILFVIELIGAGIIFGFRTDIKQEAIKGILRQMKDYNETAQGYSVIDDLQRSLHCCGAENVTDWHTNPGPFQGKTYYPVSCCEPEIKKPENCTKTWDKPCWEAVEEEFRNSSRTLANSAIAVAVIQFFAIIASCVLARNIKKEYAVV